MNSSTTRSKLVNPAVFVILTLLTVVIGARNMSVGGFSWSDAPLHAMDGVFIHDLLTERPTGDLQTWAQQYYLKHQCLGIVVYYPPAFAAVEAGVFLCMGISVLAARLTVLLFAVATVWLIYRLAGEMFGTTAGVAAAILTLATPAGADWATQVMLEWPATLFVVLALWAYWKYLNKGGWFNGILVGLGTLAAYLTKQTAAFVLVVILLHAWWDKRWELLFRNAFRIPVIISLLSIGIYSTATAGYNQLAPLLVAGAEPFKHLIRPDTWIWYLRELPAIIGWPTTIGLILSILLVLTAFIKQRKSGPAADEHCRNPALPVIWMILWWLICTLFAAKEERYFFFAVPAIALFVAAGLIRLNGRSQTGLGSILLFVLCSIQAISAYQRPVYRLPDMQPAVDYLARQADADLVLIDAVRDGQFIFDVRINPDTRNRIIPMRASKFLYSRAARTCYDYQTHIGTEDQLIDWLNQLGIRYVVIEDRLPETADLSWDTPPRIMLRKALQNQTRFECVDTQPLAGNHPDFQKVNLKTYRYLQAGPRKSNRVKVRIPAMGTEIEMTLPAPKNTDDQPARTRPAK